MKWIYLQHPTLNHAELLDENCSYNDITVLNNSTDLPNENDFYYNILLLTMSNVSLNGTISLYDIPVLSKPNVLPNENDFRNGFTVLIILSNFTHCFLTTGDVKSTSHTHMKIIIIIWPLIECCDSLTSCFYLLSCKELWTEDFLIFSVLVFVIIIKKKLWV